MTGRFFSSERKSSVAEAVSSDWLGMVWWPTTLRILYTYMCTNILNNHRLFIYARVDRDSNWLRVGRSGVRFLMGAMGFTQLPVKCTGAWRWLPTSSAEVNEGVELYLYSPSGSSLPILWWTLRYVYMCLHWLVIRRWWGQNVCVCWT